MRRMPYFFEPWKAWRDTTWEVGFRSGPPRIDDEEVVGKWWAGRDRAERDAKVVLFGSGLYEPSVTYPLTSDPQVHDGGGIVGTIHPVHTDHPQAANHVEVADRIVECVNACAGVYQPAQTIEMTRQLLIDLASGQADADDKRIARLIDRLFPSDDFHKSQKRIFAEEPE